MSLYQGVDFYNIDELLTEEERLTRDSVREFADDKIMPLIATHYREGTFPTELIKPMAELGLLGANLPEKYGCAGSSDTVYGLICQELERIDSGIRSFVSVQGSLVMWRIYT